MHPRKRPRSAAAAAAALVFALAGCSSAGSEDENVFVAATGALPHLNPQMVSSPSVQQVGSAMLEPLVRMTDDYELVPWLAKDWEISGDGLTVTLNLQEGVTWHDGEPFTAADVKFNFEEIMELQAFGADAVDAMDSVEAPDDHTVVLHMAEPYGPLLPVLTLQFLLPEHVYEGTNHVDNPANRKPVGTGPMKFESFSAGDRVVLVGNGDYWGGDVAVDRAVFPVTTDPNARDLALLAGEMDWAGYVGTSKKDQIEADPDLATTKRGTLPQQVVFSMNTQNPVLADADVRRLVYSAIDRSRVVKTALPGTSSEPEGIYPPATGWPKSPDVDFTEQFAYDVAKIKRELDAAGHPEKANGWRFAIDVHYMSSLPDAAAVAQVMKSTMAKVGIKLNLQGMDTNVFTEKVYAKGDFDTAIVISTASTDPSLGITRWYTCNPDNTAAKNPSRHCDDRLDEAADGALHSSNRDERVEYLHQVEERAAEIMVSAPIVFNRAMTVYNTSRWKGVEDDRHITGHNWLPMTPR